MAITKIVSFINEILEHLGEKDRIIEDDDVWEIARQDHDIPDFDGILIGESCLALDAPIGNLELDNFEFTYYDNSADTHPYINEEKLHTLFDFKELLEIAREKEEA